MPKSSPFEDSLGKKSEELKNEALEIFRKLGLIKIFGEFTDRSASEIGEVEELSFLNIGFQETLSGPVTISNAVLDNGCRFGATITPRALDKTGKELISKCKKTLVSSSAPSNEFTHEVFCGVVTIFNASCPNVEIAILPNESVNLIGISILQYCGIIKQIAKAMSDSG